MVLHRAFGLVFAVVAVPHDHLAARRGSRAEVRSSGVILKPDELAARRIREEIADESLLSRARRDVEDSDTRDRGTGLRHVLVAEELVAAADREDRGAGLYGLAKSRTVLAREVGPHDVLALVLPSADKPDVGPVRVRPFGDRVGPHLHGDASPLRALSERDHVAAIAVDVHEVRIEVRDPEVHFGQSSQNGTVAPARASTARSACIAVYVASTTTSPPSGARVVARSIAARHSSTTSMRSWARPAYFRRSARSRPRRPVITACSTDGARASKSASQIQETSRPSASRSLKAARTRGVRPVSRSAPIAALNPAGFFTRTKRSVRPRYSIDSSRPNAGRKLASAPTASPRSRSSARAAASAASALYALYRPGIGTRTDSKAPPPKPASAISVAFDPSTTFRAEPSRGGRERPHAGHDQSPTWARTTRLYWSGSLQRGHRVASLIACGTMPPTPGSSTPKKIVFASRPRARVATRGSSAFRTSFVVTGSPARAAPILFARVSSSK